ncbi:MAG: hypothetical protein RLZZ241_1932 [Bacteroidota bacterium]|jgi:CrcB protein
MKQLALVIVGGGIGSGLRYLVSAYLNPLFSGFYLGTITVNIIGCLIIGLLFGVSLRQEFINPVQSSFFVTGICGGFTTFSTFGLEQFLLIREGNYTHVLLYTFGSLILGVLAVGLGFWLARYLS